MADGATLVPADARVRDVLREAFDMELLDLAETKTLVRKHRQMFRSMESQNPKSAIKLIQKLEWITFLINAGCLLRSKVRRVFDLIRSQGTESDYSMRDSILKRWHRIICQAFSSLRSEFNGDRRVENTYFDYLLRSGDNSRFLTAATGVGF